MESRIGRRLSEKGMMPRGMRSWRFIKEIWRKKNQQKRYAISLSFPVPCLYSLPPLSLSPLPPLSLSFILSLTSPHYHFFKIFLRAKRNKKKRKMSSCVCCSNGTFFFLFYLFIYLNHKKNKN